MDPLAAAGTLRSLFYADGEDAPTIETDLYGRRLIVRGTAEQIAQIKQVLADLGEDGSGLRQRAQSGGLRRFPLSGRNPQDFLKVLQQQWESQNQATKIHIVIPDQENPIRSLRTPDEEFGQPDELESESGPLPELSQKQSPTKRQAASHGSTNVASQQWGWQKPADARRRYVATRGQVDEATTGQANTAQSPSVKQDWDPNRRPAAPAGKRQNVFGDKDVFVQALGDDLVLSGNPDKLDELEDLLDFLHQSLPMKAEYTVVYLRAADALEASDMLSQFFPSSTVATTSIGGGSSMLGGLGGALGGLSSNLMDVTGLSDLGAGSSTLKIIPDIRTNSLFLTGPQSLINDALAFLKVLDSDEIPESMKDMQPRDIELQYADINDVHNLLKEVFKTYLEPQGGGGKQQQQNPLAAMFGQSGGGKGGNAATMTRMTIGVYPKTSRLTINSNKALYDQVAQVVKNEDQAAREARPTIRPIQLKNADAALIQQMLGSMFPKVNISGSTSRSGGSSSSNQSGQSSNNNAEKAQQAQREAFQRAIEQRTREAAGGGAGGRGAGGGRALGGAGGGRTGAGGGGAGGGRRGGR